MTHKHDWKLVVSSTGELCRAELHTCKRCYLQRHTTIMNEAHPHLVTHRKKYMYIDFNGNVKTRFVR